LDSADHNVCCVCEAKKQTISSCQLAAADLRRAGDAKGAAEAWAKMEKTEKDLDAHLQEDLDMRRQVNGLVDGGKALRKHNLETGVYETASVPFPASASREDCDDEGGSSSSSQPSARRRVPWNTVPGIRVFHIDDKSATEIPSPKKACVGDTRGLYTVQVNGQHDCVTDVQLNYLSFGRSCSSSSFGGRTKWKLARPGGAGARQLPRSVS
jgi:hypothetical protein